MKKSLLSILACFTLAFSVPVALDAAPASVPDVTDYLSFLSPSDATKLLAQGELTAPGTRASLLPFGVKAPFAAEIQQGLSVPGAAVAMEGLFLFPRPAGNIDLGIYNAVSAVASMEGLEYYSVSQKKIEKLILASYRVSSVEKPQKLSDPSFTAIPPLQKAIVFQIDNRLGDGFSEILWKALPNGTVVMRLKNLQTLNYGILPLVDSGNLQMLFVIVPLTDRVLVYGVMEARTASLFGLERSKDESFRNRMRALAGWLGSRIAALGSGS